MLKSLIILLFSVELSTARWPIIDDNVLAEFARFLDGKKCVFEKQLDRCIQFHSGRIVKCNSRTVLRSDIAPRDDTRGNVILEAGREVVSFPLKHVQHYIERGTELFGTSTVVCTFADPAL